MYSIISLLQYFQKHENYKNIKYDHVIKNKLLLIKILSLYHFKYINNIYTFQI